MVQIRIRRCVLIFWIIEILCVIRYKGDCFCVDINVVRIHEKRIKPSNLLVNNLIINEFTDQLPSHILYYTFQPSACFQNNAYRVQNVIVFHQKFICMLSYFPKYMHKTRDKFTRVKMHQFWRGHFKWFVPC